MDRVVAIIMGVACAIWVALAVFAFVGDASPATVVWYAGLAIVTAVLFMTLAILIGGGRRG